MGMRDRLSTLTLVFITLAFSTYATSYIFKTQHLFSIFIMRRVPENYQKMLHCDNEPLALGHCHSEVLSVT